MTTTKIATSSPTDITVRGKSLTRDLIGKLSFTEMMCLNVLGQIPDKPRIAVIDACLVALMEHGLTPSALATRLIYGSAPEAMQGAVAAGLLGVGSQFVGTVEGCALLLVRISASQDPAAEAAAIVAETGTPGRIAIPGFGHDTHKPDDPRTPRLFEVAREHGIAGKHVAALELLGAALDAAKRRHITINATGAVAAVLADAGIPVEIMRGFALITRCAGLVAHVHEEQRDPAMRSIWEAADRAVSYRDPDS
jgi:citrate synthase